MPTRLRRTALGAAAALSVVLAAPAAQAVSLLRDAGVEHALNTLARPLLTAAGLPANRTRVYVVNDTGLNAFVVNSRAIFINAGLIMRVQTADQLQSVIAHETAHIANGHFARRGLNAQAAQANTALGLLLGVAAGAVAGDPGAGAAVALGAHNSARRVYFGHTREEESAADKSGLRFMARAGVDPYALREVLEIFEGQEALTPGRQDPYARSHPLSRDRIRAVELTAGALRPIEADRAEAQYWFERARSKLSAYLRSPSYTLTRIKAGDDSDAALIGRALAHFKRADLPAARAELAQLLERHPDDAYLHELSGWMELESARVAPAVAAYARAAELAPREPLILAGYGRALLAKGTAQANANALEILEKARDRDRYDARMLRDLSVAYARAGQNGQASLATAERYALRGEMKDARVHANRASGLLPTGSPGWARAQDIVRAAEQSERR